MPATAKYKPGDRVLIEARIVRATELGHAGHCTINHYTVEFRLPTTIKGYQDAWVDGKYLRPAPDAAIEEK